MSYLLVDPDSELNFQFDWSDWLVEEDTIASRLWTITPMNSGSPSTPELTNHTSEVVFVTGLLLGKVYRLSERITTVQGITDERSIVLRVEQT